MISFRSGVATLALFASATQAQAAGDLLVAPTRVILDGARGTEVILNNVGAQPATYRISLELRRMTASGQLEDVATGTETEKEKATVAMITYAPRRIVLPPNQPQAIRIGARFAADLPDGEYRAHMLFRAIPDARPVTTEAVRPGLSIALTPIYGVTIPIIIRKGALKATAKISDVRRCKTDDRGAEIKGANPDSLCLTLARSGERSTFGRIRITRPGVARPLFEAAGLAVYAEISSRTVALPTDPALLAQLTGPVKVEYLEDSATGGGLIAETQAVIR
jgi:P pilus assembly chaperone PapD